MMKKEKKKLGLTTKIFIALILGCICGIIMHYFVPEGYVRDTIIVNGVFYVVGNGFLRLMKMLVVPLVFCSLICGSMAMGDTKSLGKVGIKTLLFYLLTTALAISVALGVANIINPGIGLDTSSIQAQETTVAESTSVADTLLNIIPENPVASLANGTMLQIIFFALFVGILLAKLGERANLVSNFVSQCNDIMMEMTSAVMYVAPIGVFCLIAKTFSGIGFSAFVPLLKYMLGVLIALAIQCLVVYQGLLKITTGLNPIVFLKKFFPVMAFAFSTATSNATIPLSTETLDVKLGVSRKISSFTIPLGATINMDGTAIMQGVAVVFAAQAFGIDLTGADYLTVILTATLASVGTAGVPGVGLVTLSMVFASVGLPVEAIGLIMGIDRILDMTRTAVNITGDAVCTTIIAHQSGLVDRERFYSTIQADDDAA
ncbi:dicarboxylate/amino acid:cation symporter [Butyricicoccus sp.]|uniref:dicarboxylate/amino acid:cation symporter n=1 Tax=Butyricicoccus sp. TaxID=2049021 RepID=UPI003F1549F5